MIITKGSKLVMQGDSITDCGRTRPIGEGNLNLGAGYAKFVDALLSIAYPELGIRVLNTAISGNTTRELLNRWDEDTLALKPDWVSIFIGINDVWRHFSRPLMKETHVSIDEYTQNLEKLITSTKKATNNIILITPFFLVQDSNDAMRIQMMKYREVVKNIAEKYSFPYADPQVLFDQYLKTHHPHSLANDCVHVNHTGQMIIAKALLNAIGFDWNRMI